MLLVSALTLAIPVWAHTLGFFWLCVLLYAVAQAAAADIDPYQQWTPLSRQHVYAVIIVVVYIAVRFLTWA